MNQLTVVDAFPIEVFTIEHMALNPAQSYPLQWVVWGHGPDDEVQLFDSFDSLDEAEKAYPDAVTVTADDYDWPSDTIPQ